jgi:hypothetical protein
MTSLITPPSPIQPVKNDVHGHLDQLVIGTSDLARGRLWLEKFLGVKLGQVAVEPVMGTHQQSVAIGTNAMLTLVAIHPDLPQPPQPRYYGLDTADVRERIALRPRLIGWVARTPSIENTLAHTGGLLGQAVSVNDGQISCPNDGYPIEGGLIPHMIERSSTTTTNLPDQGLRFTWMEAAHPNPAKVEYLLTELGLAKSLVLTSSPPYAGMTMCAYVESSLGTKTFMS